MRNVIAIALALTSFLTVSVALAQTGSSTPAFKPLPVIFPIAELGGCTSKGECKAYCDVDANHDACFAYAQTHGLMTADAIQKARAFLQQHPVAQKIVQTAASSTIAAVLAAGPGPGGCTTQSACKTYCDDTANAAECLQFAKDHHLMAATAITLAQKLLAQVGPGGCMGEACKTYCDDSAHEQVCVAFAQQNGFISKDDADKRLQEMKFSSTTRPMPPIPTDGTGTIASSTLRGVRPDVRAGSSTGSSIENGQKPPPPPPRPGGSNAGQESGQSSSILFGVLHFFGL